MNKLVLIGGLSLAAAIFFGFYFLNQPPEARPVTNTGQAMGGDVATAFSSSIAPLPLSVDLDLSKVILGEKLFHDTRLSGDNSISCASCHSLTQAGTINQPLANGIKGRQGKRNVPTVFNSGYNFVQFWDGRSKTLEDQMEKPMLDPLEMEGNWPELLKKLRQDPEYVQLFSVSYQSGISKQSVKDAIATFERSLITPSARFDQFLRGNNDVLNADEKEGYRLFNAFGCIACHQGINVGGNLFQKFGIFTPYINPDPNKEPDYGRYNITGVEADKFVFKVPSLRNVAKTAPYFHDGSVATLDEAVLMMGQYQLGRELSAGEVEKICQFLETLTGEYKKQPL